VTGGDCCVEKLLVISFLTPSRSSYCAFGLMKTAASHSEEAVAATGLSSEEVEEEHDVN